jgi:hypothetical protein
VRVSGGLWGYVDRAGALVVEPRYSRVEPFARGLAQVEVDGEGFTWIDREGRMVVEPSY